MKTVLTEIFFSELIALLGTRESMGFPINFDDQFPFKAKEICNERPQGNLPTKLQTAKTLGPDLPPQGNFPQSLIHAKSACP
ncbi:MAG: hypothetical protein PHN33_06500, partial [Candidatus Peribacteraceae bacterium]|nr:hypothetical protein [Candidatus Peribacteraceae bacterium]